MIFVKSATEFTENAEKENVKTDSGK